MNFLNVFYNFSNLDFNSCFNLKSNSRSNQFLQQSLRILNSIMPAYKKPVKHKHLQWSDSYDDEICKVHYMGMDNAG